ncbi:MAG: GyrI-like domain-containing protein [Candidatus Berkelbacteria bacterium]|nr:GyrI-like domain-containing protein [Candidatus Berkelbacteria bacterium]
MAKIDYKKELRELYSPKSDKISEVKVPWMNFIIIDGKGDPNKEGEFQQAIESLYPVAYGIKFAVKKDSGVDFGVMPLEALWWAENMKDFDPDKGNRDNWLWSAMIMQPKEVTANIFEKIVNEVKTKKNLPLIERIRFESIEEGEAVQIMHIGPFSQEGPNILRLHQAIAEKGAKLTGKHHEIYLSDMRRVAPEKLKTVLRQPFAK